MRELAVRIPAGVDNGNRLRLRGEGLKIKLHIAVTRGKYKTYLRYKRDNLRPSEAHRIIEQAVRQNEPPLHQGRRIKLFYGAQVSTRPPTFVVFVNYPDAIHFSYKRYLTNQIRRETGLEKTPIRILFRERKRRDTFHKY